MTYIQKLRCRFGYHKYKVIREYSAYPQLVHYQEQICECEHCKLKSIKHFSSNSPNGTYVGYDHSTFLLWEKGVKVWEEYQDSVRSLDQARQEYNRLIKQLTKNN